MRNIVLIAALWCSGCTWSITFGNPLRAPQPDTGQTFSISAGDLITAKALWLDHDENMARAYLLARGYENDDLDRATDIVRSLVEAGEIR